MDRKELAKYIKSKLEVMKTIRQKGESVRWEACSFMAHRVPEYTNGKTPIKTVHLYYADQIDAAQTTCRGIAAYMVSPSIRWFKFLTKGKDHEDSDEIYGANDWLEGVASTIQNLFASSRFYANTLLAIEDCFVSGTSFEMVNDDVKNGLITFDCYDPTECYIAEDMQRNVNTFFREYTITAEQAFLQWGDILPEQIQRLVQTGAGSTECEFVHAIFPKRLATDKDGNRLLGKGGKEYASIHYSRKGDAVFKVGGYDTFPLAIQRWSLKGSSPYGVSPVMDLLPNIKELNEDNRQYAIAVQLQNSPVLLVPEALRGKFSYRPGAINYGSTQAGKPEIVQTQLNINYLAQKIATKTTNLRSMLFADLFNILMKEERQRTAYEVQELKGEGLVLLSSIIGNMQIEKLNPIVMRTFGIMYKAKMLPEPPAELLKLSVNGQIKVELDGPLAQNMKAYHQTTGLTQGLQAVASTVQIFPEALVNIDGDAFVRQYATAMGMPQSVIREKADVAKIKQEQATAQQQQAQQQQALDRSQVLKNLSSVQGTPAQQLAQGQVGLQ